MKSQELRYEDYALPKLKSEVIHKDHILTTRVCFPGEEYPQELRQLRQKVFVEETGLDNEPFYNNDQISSHLMLYMNNRLIGAIAVAAGENSDFNEYTNLTDEQLKKSVFITRAIVDPEFRKKGYYKVLIYSALSRFRRQGRTRVLAYSEENGAASKSVMDLIPILGAKKRIVGEYQVGCYEGDIDYICHQVMENSSKENKEYLLKTEAVDDIEYYTKMRLKEFYKGNFAKKVISGTLSKQAYIESLAHTHGYVRWTTRILGQQFINIDSGLFAKFAKEIVKHLSEEIGHPEMVIENMEACGASKKYVDYVRKGMVTNRYVDAFMSTQESAVSWRKDPVSFLGVPIAIEGVTAFMPENFRKGLIQCRDAWGIAEADKAKSTTFWLSHLEFDNPHNGHWARTIGLLREVLQNETQVIQIRNYIDNVVSNITAGYDQSIDMVLN